ncbi:MAG: MBL fold metallo-hydrolase [Acidobacteriia bacterium]|nr:MBL fold metallo-hydrolase [Terriglobia bacterium]
MIFETFPVGLLQCNCAILGDEVTREAIVIDPGDEVERILAALKKHDLKLRRIMNTHTHIDHVGANAELRDRTGAEVCLHKADLPLLENLKRQAAMIGIPEPPASRVDAFLETGDVIRCGSIHFGVLHTPGHTPGSLTFETEMLSTGGKTGKSSGLISADTDIQPVTLLEGNKAPRQVLFTGDTLFMSSIGRTDLWGGSYETILKSLAGILRKYDDSTLVYPGHGPATTIGYERQFNPFLQELM